MTRTHAPQEIRDRREDGKQKPVPSPSPLRRNISKSVKMVGVGIGLLATSLGIITGYLALVPRLSVTQNQPLNLDDPFSTPFILSNDGPLGVNDAKFSCYVFHLASAPAGRLSSGTSTIDEVGASQGLVAKRMEPGERATIPCSLQPFTLMNPVKTGDVAVQVDFRPDFVFWRQTRSFRFVTLKSSDGHLYWYPEPITGPPSRTAR